MKKVNVYLSNGETLEAKTNANNDFTIAGELVFTTSMTGYQELITDPSYAGQIVITSYPMIGNYGVINGVDQSEVIHAKGMIVQTIESDGLFEDFLNKKNAPLIHSVDTRSLILKIRLLDYPKCVISTLNLDQDTINENIKSINPNVIQEISVKQIKKISGFIQNDSSIGVIDFGIKRGIIEKLKNYFQNIFLLPYDIDYQQIKDLGLIRIMLSNGPGDPDLMDVSKIKNMIGKVDLYGICLGHQLLAIAAGCKTYKMQFGHRGTNHPVINLLTKRVIITSQNHGYAVEKESIPDDVIISHVSLNDGSVEGIESQKKRIKTVQFHPESSPGPSDAGVVFDEWFKNLQI